MQMLNTDRMHTHTWNVCVSSSLCLFKFFVCRAILGNRQFYRTITTHHFIIIPNAFNYRLFVLYKRLGEKSGRKNSERIARDLLLYSYLYCFFQYFRNIFRVYTVTKYGNAPLFLVVGFFLPYRLFHSMKNTFAGYFAIFNVFSLLSEWNIESHLGTILGFIFMI